MNPFDLLAVLVLVVAIGAGIRTGALPQVGGIVGALGVLAALLQLSPWFVHAIADVEPVPRALLVVAILLGGVLAGEAVGSAAGRSVAGRLGRGVLSSVDRLAGGLLGAAQAVLIVWLVGGLLAAGPFPQLGRAAASSTAVRVTDRFLPPPTSVVGTIAGVLDQTGLPDVFIGLEPLPLAPVETPSDPQAARIARAAEAGTARVTSRACSLQVTGTGVLVAPGYLVTNAHVVAGASTIRVSIAGDVVDAQAVLFDPALDVALLYAPAAHGSPLRFAASDPRRGATGATLGYPGGGGLAVLPAAVAGGYPATGRDIYGSRPVTRDVLELRAAIEPGDSGGPFVLQDGAVGGLVFAESRSDHDIGYALTPTRVAARVAPALGRTAAVDVGPCLR